MVSSGAVTELLSEDDSIDGFNELERRLLAELEAMGCVLVALSGGVDSAYLAWAARCALGANARAVTGVSPSLPVEQRRVVEALVEQVGIAHTFVETHELDVDGYVRNAPDRCYFCKSELYGLLDALAAERRGSVVVDGTNYDDLGDHRPGRIAASERGVRSPLMELGIGKRAIRWLARRADLPVWDAPASACLASRIPHGTPVTIGRLGVVERAESALRRLGFRQFRVRHHGPLARLEFARDELARAVEFEAGIATAVLEHGFARVEIDPAPYRSREGVSGPVPASEAGRSDLTSTHRMDRIVRMDWLSSSSCISMSNFRFFCIIGRPQGTLGLSEPRRDRPHGAESIR